MEEKYILKNKIKWNEVKKRYSVWCDAMQNENKKKEKEEEKINKKSFVFGFWLMCSINFVSRIVTNGSEWSKCALCYAMRKSNASFNRLIRMFIAFNIFLCFVFFFCWMFILFQFKKKNILTKSINFYMLKNDQHNFVLKFVSFLTSWENA